MVVPDLAVAALRLYVCGKWEERPRIREVMATLRSFGHEITCDWTYADTVSRETAQRDLNGVVAAEAVVFVAEHDLNYKGALVEVGIALGRNIPVYVIGEACDACIFWQLPLVRKGVADLMRAEIS